MPPTKLFLKRLSLSAFSRYDGKLASQLDLFTNWSINSATIISVRKKSNILVVHAPRCHRQTHSSSVKNRIPRGVQSWIAWIIKPFDTMRCQNPSETSALQYNHQWKPESEGKLKNKEAVEEDHRERRSHSNNRKTMEQLALQLSTATYGVLSRWRTPSMPFSGPPQPKNASPLLEEMSREAATKDARLTSTTSSSNGTPEVTSKSSLDSRARHLVHSLGQCKSNMSYHLRLEELCKFLRKHPDAQSFAAKAGGVRHLLLVHHASNDPTVHEGVQEALALLGHCRPPGGWGVRILSIDGGGLRGIMGLEVLRHLEQLTGCPVHLMFDYICGVSTGAILTVLLGALKSSIPKCEQLYKQIGSDIFQQNRFWGTGKLVLSHAFYDTAQWTKLTQENVGEMLLIETARDAHCPKIATVSTVVNRPTLEAFLFRNYDYPPRVRSQYRGTHAAHLWEAIRASAAAPGYFEEYKLGEDVHQDGGIHVNNPTALALHECKHLWPNEQVQCVVSLGSGRYEPQGRGGSSGPSTTTSTGLKQKLMKIVDSATDTESVHTILHDLLPPTVYFRFNPYLTENISLDETRQEKILQLQEDTKMYLRRNENKLKLAASLLVEPRTRLQTFRDYIALKTTTFLG